MCKVQAISTAGNSRFLLCHIVRCGKGNASVASLRKRVGYTTEHAPTDLVILSLLHGFDTVQWNIGCEVLVM